MIEEAGGLGFSPAALAELGDYLSERAAADQEDYVGVWPQNAETVEAFLSCATQWRHVSVVTREGAIVLLVGLDYAGARAGLEASGMTVTPALWRDLRIMEAEAIAASNERP